MFSSNLQGAPMFHATSAPFYPKTTTADLTYTDILFMSEDVFGAMTPAEIGSLSDKATFGIQPGQISVLRPDQLASLKHSQLSSSVFSGLKPEQVSGLSPEVIKDMDTCVLMSIRNSTLRAFSDSQLQAINLDAMVGSFPMARLCHLRDRISAFTPAQMASIRDDCFQLDISQMKHLKPEVCAVLTEPQLSRLSAAHFGAMSVEGVGGLTLKQFDALTVLQRSQFTAEQIGALNPEILKKHGYEN
ncbi:MAG: hypothetical protein Q8K31_07895 [Burkholderiaceae bacterium]|nr:hypothetical protein [Burkholderiaceae bacterium]